MLNNHNSVVALLLNTPNIDVNLKNDYRDYYGNYGFHNALQGAVRRENIEALKLLLNVPNIDVNIVDNHGRSALHHAVTHDIEGLKLLLSHPAIDVNIVDNYGASAVFNAVEVNNIEVLKLLLSHPSLTARTLNQKDNRYGATPLMRAVRLIYSGLSLGQMELLFADLRVDLDTTDEEGRSLEEVARWNFLVAILFNSHH